jgi:hypothetical protein
MQSASVQECPAYYLCKPAGASCDDCLEMTVDQWRAFVKTVLGQQPLEIAGMPKGSENSHLGLKGGVRESNRQ